MAGGRRRAFPLPAHTGSRLDGDRSSDSDVNMPHIAITACQRLEDYKQAILHTGGDVHVVDASMTIPDALQDIDGLLLTGGDDVAPSRYGEEKHHAVQEVPPERDEFELALIREARQR